MKFILSSLKILLMQTKLRSHSIEYFCFYLNNQLLLFADHETPLLPRLASRSQLNSHDESHLAASRR